MELTLEEIPNSMIEMFSNFPDDSMVVNVKWNYSVDELDQFPGYDLQKYVKELGCVIHACSAGIHLNGENHQPHVHYHFITSPFKIPSNPSQHRRRWYNKEEMVNPEFLNCSFKFHPVLDKKTPQYSVLSYPLKEGRQIADTLKVLYAYYGKPMTKEQIEFLKSVGNAIYEKELGLKQRQDKCDERKKVGLTTLFELCKQNADKFSTYKSMVSWLDNNYISTLQIDEYPDPKNYKTNCQKICIALGKLKYSDIL